MTHFIEGVELLPARPLVQSFVKQYQTHNHSSSTLTEIYMQFVTVHNSLDTFGVVIGVGGIQLSTRILYGL